MANILFKKGSYDEFKKLTTFTEGALYLTEDEGGLYLGLANNQKKRIQGSVLYFDSLIRFENDIIKAPPYSTEVLYFVATENALLRYTGSEWVQLNVTASNFNKLSNTVDGLSNTIDSISGSLSELIEVVGEASDKNEGMDATGLFARIEALESLTGTGDGEGSLSSRLNALETWQKTISETVSENTQAAKDAQDTADSAVLAAQRNKESIDAITDETTGILAQAKKDLIGVSSDKFDANTIYGAKSYADNAVAAAKTQLAGEENSEKTLVGAYAAAKNAQDKADGNAIDITNITKSGGLIDQAKTVLIGTASDTKDANTIYGAKKYAADLIAANDAMTFIGVLDGNATEGSDQFADLPATGNRGDTYKVGAAGTYAGTSAKIGDLFINTADDGASAKWEHISSGFEDEYVQILSASDNKIKLSDGITSGNGGTISVVGGTSGNVTIEAAVSGTGKDTVIAITPSFTWGTFE